MWEEARRRHSGCLSYWDCWVLVQQRWLMRVFKHLITVNRLPLSKRKLYLCLFRSQGESHPINILGKMLRVPSNPRCVLGKLVKGQEAGDVWAWMPTRGETWTGPAQYDACVGSLSPMLHSLLSIGPSFPHPPSPVDRHFRNSGCQPSL